MTFIMKNRTVWLAILIGCLVTPALYWLAALYSGGGHSLVSMIVAFPYGMIWGLVFKGIAEWPGVVLLGLQYPLYGLLLGVAKVRNRSSRCLLVLLMLHTVVTAVGLLMWRKG